MLELLHAAPVTPQVLGRAREVQGVLAARSQHRGIAPADLLIAAAAEAADLPVLHHDGDYDRITAVTGRTVPWAASPGSLP